MSARESARLKVLAEIDGRITTEAHWLPAPGARSKTPPYYETLVALRAVLEAHTCKPPDWDEGRCWADCPVAITARKLGVSDE